MASSVPTSPEQSVVRTVLGDVAASQIGRVAFHEHVLFDLVLPDRRGSIADPAVTIASRWQIDYLSNRNANNARQMSAEVAGRELTAFASDGGSLIVDQSTFGIGRNASGLRTSSAESGVHVVAAAGTYVADYLDPETLALDAERLERRFVDEIESGLDGTAIRAGLIGEIGCSWPLHPFERQALVAAVRAARRTGAAISVHPGRHRDAPFEIVDILSAAGADLSRIVICHMDRTFPDGQGVADLLATGVCVEWDFFGIEQSHYWFGDVELPTDMQRLRLIARFMDAGFGERIVISQDICSCTRLQYLGGHGYGHLLRNVPALMRRAGFTPDRVEQLLRRNPLRLLTLARSAGATIDRTDPE